MKKLITLLLAILISLIPTLTRTQPTAPQADTYEPTAITEPQYEPTVDSETESLMMATTEPKVIVTELPVAPVDASCDEIQSEPEAVPDTEEATAVREKSEETVEPSVEVASSEPEPITEQSEDKSEPAPDITDEATSSGVTCVDNGNSNIAPYTPADDQGMPNPFVNTPPTEVTEIDAEDLIQPGDDRPGEGIHF